jgi:hypothetical protein
MIGLSMIHDTRAPNGATDPLLADLLELIDRLEEQVTTGKRVPLSNRVMVEEEEFLSTVDQLRQSLPNEIRQARRVVQDRQKVILEAQAEAEKIIGFAKERAEYLISEKGLAAEARVRSEDVLRQARDQAKRSKSEINTYAMKVFDEIERALRGGLDEIQGAKEALAQHQ